MIPDEATGQIHKDNWEEKAAQLLCWYDSSAKKFLSEQEPAAIASLDDDRARLGRWLEGPRSTMVCLIGPSAVGKSTLLNVLVTGQDLVVPAGGTGPLTALATEIKYGEQPQVEVWYHKKKYLWQVAFAINAHVERARKAAGVPATSPADANPVLDAAPPTDGAEDETSSGDSRRPVDEMLRLARLIVTGSQLDTSRPAEYLADALTQACGYERRWGSELQQADLRRIARVQAALAMAEEGKSECRSIAAGPRLFREFLDEHAAGFLAPLIQRMEAKWNSSLLEGGLTLTDLPGVGVEGDVYRAVTQRFVREQARAVVLVVDRAGVTESVMEVLRSSGYWDRLIASSDDPDADPCALLVAVTRVDDVAEEHWRQQLPDSNGKRAKKKSECFAEVRQELQQKIRQQLESQLSALGAEDAGEAVSAARKIAGQALLATLAVHPVSAPQFRRLLADDADDRPFLSSPEQTGIPQFQAELANLATRNTTNRISRIRAVAVRFFEALTTHVDVVESRWREGTRAAEEAERVRKALDEILEEKVKEYDSRRASFRNYLTETVPEKIKSGTLEAREEARKSIAKYLNSLRDAHWATLRAAVRKYGTFYGARQIALPTDIAVRFQEPIAATWSQGLLKDIRQATYALASDVRAMVVEVCDWAEENAGTVSDPRVVDQQKRLVSAQAEQLREVGKDAIEDLRAAVLTKVSAVIEKPIAKACEDFVSKGDDVGPGVKSRILRLFEELAESSVEAARRPAEKILIDQYGTVRADVQKAFKNWERPLESAADAIVERHEDRERRSNAQRRGAALAAVKDVRASMPAVSLGESAAAEVAG